MKIGPNFFLQHFKNNIINNFVKFVATKKRFENFFFHPSLCLLFLDPGSGIRDPGSGMGKNQDPGSTSRIRHTANQGCGSGSVLDPYSIGSVDPDSESGSGCRRAKMTHKSTQ